MQVPVLYLLTPPTLAHNKELSSGPQHFEEERHLDSLEATPGLSPQGSLSFGKKIAPFFGDTLTGEMVTFNLAAR